MPPVLAHAARQLCLTCSQGKMGSGFLQKELKNSILSLSCRRNLSRSLPHVCFPPLLLHLLLLLLSSLCSAMRWQLLLLLRLQDLLPYAFHLFSDSQTGQETRRERKKSREKNGIPVCIVFLLIPCDSLSFSSFWANGVQDFARGISGDGHR